MSAIELEERDIIARRAHVVGLALSGQIQFEQELFGLSSHLDGYRGSPSVGRRILVKRLTSGDDGDNHYSLTHEYPGLRALLRMAGIHPGALSEVEVVATLADNTQTVAIDVSPHIDPIVTNNPETAGYLLKTGRIKGKIRLVPTLPSEKGLLSITAFDNDDTPVKKGADEYIFAFTLEEFGLNGPRTIHGFDFELTTPAELFKDLCLVAFDPKLEKLQPSTLLSDP